jgi:hypothetical protein
MRGIEVSYEDSPGLGGLFAQYARAREVIPVSADLSVTDPIEAARVYQKVMGEDAGV